MERIGEIGCCSYLCKANRFLRRTGHEEFAILHGYVGSAGFQHVRSNVLHLLLQSLDSSVDGGATHRHCTAPVRVASFWRRVGVAMEHHNVLYGNAKFLSSDL